MKTYLAIILCSTWPSGANISVGSSYIISLHFLVFPFLSAIHCLRLVYFISSVPVILSQLMIHSLSLPLPSFLPSSLSLFLLFFSIINLTYLDFFSFLNVRCPYLILLSTLAIELCNLYAKFLTCKMIACWFTHHASLYFHKWIFAFTHLIFIYI